MIIAISIADKHKPAGKGHVGTILIEIPELSEAASHYDVLAVICPGENEHLARAYGLNRLLTREQMEAQGEIRDGSGQVVKRGRTQ